jgi:hypothetical protein
MMRRDIDTLATLLGHVCGEAASLRRELIALREHVGSEEFARFAGVLDDISARSAELLLSMPHQSVN